MPVEHSEDSYQFSFRRIGRLAHCLIHLPKQMGPCNDRIFTFQGLGIWWLISWFTMPGEVARYNQLLADQAFNDVMMVRPQAQQPAPALSMSPTPLES
jgi:hypothetical protein